MKASKVVTLFEPAGRRRCSSKRCCFAVTPRRIRHRRRPVESSMHWNVFSPLRALAAALLLCLAAPDVLAQSPRGSRAADLAGQRPRRPVRTVLLAGDRHLPRRCRRSRTCSSRCRATSGGCSRRRRTSSSPASADPPRLSAGTATHRRLRRTGGTTSLRARPASSAFAIQTGAGLVTYGIGRVTDSPRAARIGAGIFRAQLVSRPRAGRQGGLGRTRPDGSNSHRSPRATARRRSPRPPSSSASRLEGRDPGVAIAGWVAASRAQMKRHDLSDVIAGAIVGILPADR